MADGNQSGNAPLGGDVETTEDAFLGGRVRVLQPRRGFRSGVDAVLLAAALPVREGRGAVRVLDCGAGVGVVGLAVAARHPGASVVLVEREAALARLAGINIARNALQERVGVAEADLLGRAADIAAAGLAAHSFDHALANPPYQVEGRGQRPSHPIRRGAREMEAGGLERWMRFLARMLKPGGTATIVHRADALADVLAAMQRRFGAIKVLPLHPREGEPAVRILVEGTLGSRAPLSIRAGVVLHEAEGHGYRPEVARVLAGEAGLEWAMGTRQ